TGYHRRDADVAFLEARLAASGSRGPAMTAPPSGPVVSANPSLPGRGALAVWREKLEYFLEQEAVSADPAQKFALRKQIEEAERRIRELGG
ncbi:MAG: hypothetical protein GY856_42670, partial [bacterium]|nr:hypothetical protein [bacterium]